MIYLFQPDLTQVTSVEEANLALYAEKHGLAFIKLNRKASYVVFDRKAKGILDSIDSGSAKLIKAFEGTITLSKRISDELECNEIVAFEATRSTMRHFYTVAGFISVMYKVKGKIEKGKICLPPGCYGSRYLFAVCKDNYAF